MSERDLFLKALDISDPAARAAFLDRECAGDSRLRRSVEALLAAGDAAGDFLDQPHPAVGVAEADLTGPHAGGPESQAEHLVGSVIAGKYKLLQAIGEGGMGSVFMADQLHPVKRRVAVKLIRVGMDSAQVLARFEAERQALALMDHPHIAKVLDAGTTEANRPYFVMELVKGIPVTDYCDQHKVSIADRLSLFVQICSAVQHAHQKGIIHRDLKPSNILVESHDGKPVPKVIDFGLAKAMSGQALTEHTLFTALGQVAGTPLYMAPEQAAFNALDVDTRADVYALGVLLYELLTGTTPLEREQLRKKAFDEILRIIRDSEPPVPSKRLSSADTTPNVAAVRGTEPAKLSRFVKGDLDWIVMKALAKERDRRYETANGFARDVERFLNHEPVSVGPPSAAYRLRKFVQRHRPQVVAGGLVLLAVLLGFLGTAIGFVRAEQRRVEAEKAREKEAEQRRIAEEEKGKAEQAEAATLASYRANTDEAIEQLIGAKPELGPQERAYIEKTLARWQEFAKRQGDDQRSQAIRAEGHFRVAYLWAKLDRRDEARKEFEQARELQQKLASAFPAVPAYQQDLANTHNSLGLLLAALGQRDEARKEFEQARDLLRKLALAFPSVPDYQQGLAGTHNNLGNLLADLGQRDAAKKEYEQARDLHQKLALAFPGVPAYQIELGSSYLNFGNLVRDESKPGDSLHWFDLAIRTLTRVYEKDPRAVTAKQFLRNSHWGRAQAFDRLNKHAEAVKDWDRAIELTPRQEQPAVRALRANSRVQAGQLAEAVAEVAEWTKEELAGTPGAPRWNAGQWYNFACVYAVASGKLADKKQEYADRAMQLLHQAVKAGYRNAAHVKKDSDLDPLRDREDFQKLLADLNALKDKKP